MAGGDVLAVGVRTAAKAYGSNLVARLRGLGGGTGREGGVGGILRVGGTSYSMVAYDFERVISTVVSNPTGYRCLQALEHNLSRPAWAAWPTNAPSDEPPLEQHPLLAVLNRPAAKVSGTMLQRMIAWDTELTGKFFAVKMRGRDGFGDTGPISGLRRLAPQRVAVIGNEDDELLGFVYTDRAGNRMAALPEAIVYLRYPHPERWYDGMAPAVVAGLPSDIDTASQRFNYELLANDGALPGYITVEGLTRDQFAEWKTAWESGEYPGKTRFMGGNAQYIKVGASNKDMMQDSLRDYSQTDIQKAFGVPPAVAFDLQRETYANADAEKNLFMQQTCLSKWTLWADELTIQVGDEAGVRVGFDLDDIEELQEAQDAMSDRLIAQVAARVITRNEAREDLGRPPIEGGDEFEVPEPAVPPTGPAPTPISPAKSLVLETKASRASRYIDFQRRVGAWEGRVARKVEVFMGRQGRVIEARLRASGGKSLAKAVDPARWWDQARWAAELASDADEFLSDVVDTFGMTVMMTLAGASTGFDVRAARVRSYIEGRAAEIGRLVNETTEAELRRVLADAEASGAGIDGMADAIAAYFADNVAMRAERVARTEVIGAANYATVEAGRQSGIATGKTWLATADDRVDEDCADLDGTTVGLDEGFGEVDHPPLHPNCRCTVLIETESGTTTEEGDEG